MSDKEFIAEVIVDRYERRYISSNRIREKYFEKGQRKLPVKYCNAKLWKEQKRLEPNLEKYDWVEDKVTRKGRRTTSLFLVDLETGQRVIANPKAAGNIKYQVINGQKLHQLTMRDYERSKVLKTLKAQMVPLVAKLDPINVLPLRVLCILEDTYQDVEQSSNPNWDVDNRFLFYAKTFMDILAGCQEAQELPTGNRVVLPQTKVIIPDDHRGYVTQPPACLFTPIDDPEKRRLIFRIFHDKRSVVTNNPHYEKLRNISN